MTKQKTQQLCTLYGQLGSLKETARLSGVPPDDCAQILRSKPARRMLRRLQQEQGCDAKQLVITGLLRLAFGSANDAAALGQAEGLSAEALANLDLFNVAELKQSKSGVEIKFFDRQRALERLYEYAGTMEEHQQAKLLLEALTGEAKTIHDDTEANV